jgi:hypothetical protein
MEQNTCQHEFKETVNRRWHRISTLFFEQQRGCTNCGQMEYKYKGNWYKDEWYGIRVDSTHYTYED